MVAKNNISFRPPYIKHYTVSKLAFLLPVCLLRTTMSFVAATGNINMYLTYTPWHYHVIYNCRHVWWIWDGYCPFRPNVNRIRNCHLPAAMTICLDRSSTFVTSIHGASTADTRKITMDNTAKDFCSNYIHHKCCHEITYPFLNG